LEEAFSLITAYGTGYYLQGVEDIAGIEKLYASTAFLNLRFKNAELENKRITILAEKIVLATQKEPVILTIDITNVMNP